MTPERWQRVKLLFTRALDYPGDERISVITGSGETPSIIAEARELVSRDARATRFLTDTETAGPSGASPYWWAKLLAANFKSQANWGGAGWASYIEPRILSCHGQWLSSL
jgi:hypothetical protein